MEASKRVRRLRDRRRKAGIGQTALAARIAAISGWKVTQPVVSLIESGAFPAPAGFLKHYEGALRDDG